MKKIVVLTGAGISAESGLKTFRDADGLWEGHDVMEVASIDGWHANRELVLDFYNSRRKQALTAKPNPGHLALAELEKDFDVTVITQNVDNLHELAGSTNVLHLHGELFKSQSTVDPNLVYDMKGWELNLGDKCEKGSQLRPAIVWFGELVPMIEVATEEVYKADIFIIVGTSLVVYPAGGLIQYARPEIPKFIIDKSIPHVGNIRNLHRFEEASSTGMGKVVQLLKEQYL